MTDREKFLSKIIAEPGEDAHRLVFADWLDDQPATLPCPICHGPGFNRGGLGAPIGCTKCRGELVIPTADAARAEFIRVQVELSRMDRHATCGGYYCQTYGTGNTMHVDCRGEHLRLREQALLAAHEADWLGPDFPLWDVGFQANSTWAPEAEWGWSRGFIGRVEMSSLRFVGGECPECRYWATDGRPVGQAHAHCTACRGAKTVPGIAGAVFAAHPVERVVLTDIPAPTQLQHGRDRGKWIILAHTLPAPLRKSVLESVIGPAGSAQEVADDLNEVYVEFGRKAAGL